MRRSSQQRRRWCMGLLGRRWVILRWHMVSHIGRWRASTKVGELGARLAVSPGMADQEASCPFMNSTLPRRYGHRGIFMPRAVGRAGASAIGLLAGRGVDQWPAGGLGELVAIRAPGRVNAPIAALRHAAQLARLPSISSMETTALEKPAFIPKSPRAWLFSTLPPTRVSAGPGLGAVSIAPSA